jgi:cysteine desulfurase
MYYFDHSATTPPYDEVVDAYAEVMKTYFGNPSSIHRLGAEAERLIATAREVIAEPFGVKPEELIFTSGGTESNNAAVKGAACQYRNRGSHIVTTAVEHASVHEACRQLEREGFQVTYVRPGPTGHVRPEDIRAALRKDTILVSMIHVNNEVGSIQPVAEVGAMLREYPRILFHVDAVQSIGKIPVDIKRWGIDLLTGSAHKIRGPKGCGFLYCRSGVKLAPLIAGGGQEHGFRSGTQHVAGIVAMAKAVRMTMEKRQQHEQHLYRLRERLVEQLRQIPELSLNGSPDPRSMAPHIVHFSYPGMKSEVLVHALEEYDIYVSTQSACSSKSQEPSRILLAMGLDEAAASSGIRISMSADQTEEEVDFLIQAIKSVVRKLKPMERS